MLERLTEFFDVAAASPKKKDAQPDGQQSETTKLMREDEEASGEGRAEGAVESVADLLKEIKIGNKSRLRSPFGEG